MDVRIVDFPATKVAMLAHDGPPHAEHQTALKLVQWKLANRLTTDRHRSYGLHAIDKYHVEFCLSVDDDVPPNDAGIITKTIPACRCAVARHVGPRVINPAGVYLFTQWLPTSGEEAHGDPLIFHYVNVGPNIAPQEMITDVYLPLVTKA